MKTVSVRSICICAMFTALIIVGAFIKIPLYLVSITLQTTVIMLAALLLGPKRAAVCCTIYMLLGLVGFPIFSQGGGIGYILKPSFGYIIGFIPGAYITGRLAKKQGGCIQAYLSCLVGLCVIYLCGGAYCYFLMTIYFKSTLDFHTWLFGCIIVFLPSDLILTVFAVAFAKRLKGGIKTE